MQNLDDYLTLVGDMYYQVPESGKSTATVRAFCQRGAAQPYARVGFSPTSTFFSPLSLSRARTVCARAARSLTLPPPTLPHLHPQRRTLKQYR